MLGASVPKRCDIFDGLSVPSGVQLVLFNIIKAKRVNRLDDFRNRVLV